MDDVPRHRPMAFDKMESLIKEMQDPETGVPVRSQKLFLSIIPSAFMGKGADKRRDATPQPPHGPPAASGYDLVEWLMERFNIDETTNVEAINLGNQLCQYGYFFPVNDLKNLILKDDSSLYRFQSPYYWPWHGPRAGGSAPSLGPDNVEYAIYLVKRTLRNKQRHGLEDYEQEALANLKKNLAAKWDFINMQAEEQVRLAKERKKGDKIVSDSQERAYWRVARPPPGVFSALETCPVPVRTRQPRSKKKTIEHVQKEIEYLNASLDRTRVKSSIAHEALLAYTETFTPYDPWLTPSQPSNPWISDDTLYWQINSPLVEIPSEKRVQRWALSIEELISDPTGLQEFTSFLRKEYSHENIRFWLAVMDLRRSSAKQITYKLKEIYEEFLKPGAPCEINIDGATADKVSEGLRTGSRYALDEAAEHVYGLLLKKDCYPRFVRSDHFQRLLTEGKNVHQKKAKFFNFGGGGQVKKKPASSAGGSGSGTGLTRRRGSDRSLSGSAHELAVCAARAPDPPPHSHSQSNLAELHAVEDDAVPWDAAPPPPRRRQDSTADSGSSSSDVSAAVERRRLPQQSTLDGGLRGAPPPLRRLSAVEPRHLAPLTSPPRSPHAQRSPAPMTLAHHPTPTISVSSAPDEEDGSPDERPSLGVSVSDDSPSVFTSADATPTDVGPHLVAEPLRESQSCSDDDADSVRRVPQAASPQSPARIEVAVINEPPRPQQAPPPAVVVTSTSTVVEVTGSSPATATKPTHSTQPTQPVIVEEEVPVFASTSNVPISVKSKGKSKSEPIPRPEQANASATKAHSRATSRAPSERSGVSSEVVRVKGELTRARSEQTRGGSSLRRAGSEPCRAVAPLAEGEDCADEDAPPTAVASAPAAGAAPAPVAQTPPAAPDVNTRPAASAVPTVPVATAVPIAPVAPTVPTAPAAPSAPTASADPTAAAAPAPAVPAPPRSPRSPAHRDRKRNDVCPWEDDPSEQGSAVSMTSMCTRYFPCHYCCHSRCPPGRSRELFPAARGGSGMG